MAEVVHYQENAGQAVKKIEGRIVTPHGVIDGFLQLENGIITELSGEPAPKNAGFHPELPTIVPGFIDLHNHGGNGGAFPGSNTTHYRANWVPGLTVRIMYAIRTV